MISRLLTTYYKEPRTSRRTELDLCLAMNAMAFDRVCVLSESACCPGPGVHCRMAGERQKYSDLIAWAAAESGLDDINVIANCDIVIPQRSIKRMCDLAADQVYCLSRYEVGAGGGHRLHNSDYSQDAWCFRGPPRVNGGDYFFGVPGCDNKFALELQQSGYEVSNPSKSIKTFHIHASRERTATNSVSHRVDPPYLLPKPTHLGEVTKFRYVYTVDQIYKPRSQPVAPAVTQ